MDAEALTHHTSSRFDADLERLRANVLAMGGLVERQLQRALSGFIEADLSQLITVVREEQVVNELERSVDEDCGRILATRNPAASDLRLLISILKANADLERIGDEAEKIAAIAARRTSREHAADSFHELRRLAQLVQAMVHDSLDASARLDSRLAVDVMRRDRQVDEEYDSLQRQSVTRMTEDQHSIRRTLDVMWVVRALERVGDHAKNICENVVYAVHGKDIRHLPLEEAERQLQSIVAGGATPPQG